MKKKATLPRLTELLMCECEKIVCPVRSGVVELYFPFGDSCDMAGAIELAEMCRPGVKEIRTFSGGKPDTFYRRSGKGDWTAFMTRPKEK